MRLSTHFTLDELVHPDIITKVGDRAADFLHPELVPTLEAIRARFGAIAVNGIYKGKTFSHSGLRLPDSPIGANLSSHKFGCSCDCKFYGETPQAIQKYIIRNQSEFPHISRMENADVTVTWLHIEVTSKRNKSIKVFNP
jgi:hypothetical protein